MKENSINQAGCFENTLSLPQRGKYDYFAKASGLKNRLKAERAWFLSEEERRAKPETEQLLPRWGKSCVFFKSTGQSFLQTVFSITQPDLSLFVTGLFFVSITELEILLKKRKKCYYCFF